MNQNYHTPFISDAFSFFKDPLKERSKAVDSSFGIMACDKVPEKWIKTICGYCSVGCGMMIGVKNGRAVSVKGDPDYPVNSGKLCPKGLSEHYAIHAPNRTLYPMQQIKKNGKFARLSWDESLNIMTQKFSEIQKQYGEDSIAVISTGQLLTEEFYTLGKLVRLGLKTGNYDGNTTLCMSTAVAGYTRSFGTDGPPGSYEDLKDADCLILIGANVADNHPILMKRIQENTNKSKTVICVDPRVTKTASLSGIHLPIKPRGDLALLNGMANFIIQNNLYDKRYVEKNTDGFEQLKEGLEKYSLEYTANITGLSVEQIINTALIYANAENGTIAWTMGVNHSDQGVATVNAINNLSLLTGNIGKRGASPFSITGQCNAMGSRETAFTSSMPGYRSFLNEGHRNELASIWNIPAVELPYKRGQAYPDIIESIVQGKIKALWVIATNPVVSFPNRSYLEDALSRLDFFVIQDGYSNPTSRYADLILPSAVWGEKDGTYTNSERRVGRVQKAVNPPGEAKSDFDIFLALADKMHIKDRIYPGWKTPADAFNEWRRISKGRPCDCSGMDYEIMKEKGGIQWPFKSGDTSYINSATSSEFESNSLYSDGVFNTENGRAKFIFSDETEFPENISDNFPFILNTGRTVEHWHTRTKTGQIQILENISSGAWIEVNPNDAKKKNFYDGEKIRIVSRRGTVENIPCKITSSVRSGEVFLPFHWIEMPANSLTINAFDPISREPNYKQSAVRLEKMKDMGPM